MKINRLLISIIIVLILFVMCCHSKTYAIANMMDDAEDFLNKGNGYENVINQNDIYEGGELKSKGLKTISSEIYNILLGAGIAVAVIVGAYLGIQFLYASVEGKAKIMEALVPYVVGCVVVFGAFTIWGFAIKTGNSITDTSPEPPAAPVTTWNEATTAREYIDGGGNLANVDNETLLSWYGQLSRLSGNRGVYTDYYNQVTAEINRRGGFDSIR